MSERKYVYRPRASYHKLKQAEEAIRKAKTLGALRAAISEHGPRVGYKAFSYIFMEKMTPEAMKPEDALEIARAYVMKGDREEADEIVEKILQWHPEYRGIQPSDVLKNDALAEDAVLPYWLSSIAKED